MIGDLSFDGIRTDVRKPGDAPAIVSNVIAAGKDAIFIADHRQGPTACLEIVTAIAAAIGPDARPNMLAVEVGNECDLPGPFERNPQGFGKMVANAAEIVRGMAPTTTVVSGGISHCGVEKLRWLNAAMFYFPPDVAVGYHPYRDSGPEKGRPDYSSREEEFFALAGIAGGRPVWATEIGWHTAPRKKKGFLAHGHEWWTDEQVAKFLVEELRREMLFGAEVMAIFQIHDGPDGQQAEHRFGIRRTDGTLKPSAFAVKEWRG